MIHQGDAIILGETRFDLDADTFDREGVADVWPSIAFPRVPLGIRHADAHPVIGDANTAILFRVGRPYRRISIDGRGSWTEWIEVRPDLLEEIAGEYEPRGTHAETSPFRAGRASAPTRAYLAHRRTRWRLSQDGGVDPLALEESALAVTAEVLAAGFALAGIRRRPARGSRSRGPRDVVFDVQALLNRRLGAPLSLGDVSDTVELSPYHLCRVFQERTGMPVHRYRDRLRLRASLERIGETSARMLDIAMDLGYSSEAHFSDAFLKAFGMRPSAFRRGLTGASRARRSAPRARPA